MTDKVTHKRPNHSAAKKRYLKLIDSVKPQHEFDNKKTPSPPDYNDKKFWASFLGDDGFHLLSPDCKEMNEKKEFDVFYIHPTGFFEQCWNAPFDEESAAYERTSSHLASQASAFAQSCNIFTPYYRQATYYSFFDIASSGSMALDIAYTDIANAFKVYLEKYNQGRPFFIAGHSQGALHGQRLIHEHVSKNTSRDLFIAAYLIGYILPIKYFDGLYPDLSISQSPNDQQVIISWSTGTEGFSRSRAKSLFWTPNGWKKEKMEQPLVCNHPLSWDQRREWIEDESNISIRLKSSTLFLNDYHAKSHSHAKLSIDKIKNLSLFARLSQNYMIETKGTLIDKVASFTVDGDLHNLDIALFWGSLRNNIRVRANAFSKK